MDRLCQIMFESIKSKIEIKEKGYENFIEQQRENWRKWGRPKQESHQEEEKTQKTQAFSEKPTQSEKTQAFSEKPEERVERLDNLPYLSVPSHSLPSLSIPIPSFEEKNIKKENQEISIIIENENKTENWIIDLSKEKNSAKKEKVIIPRSHEEAEIMFEELERRLLEKSIPLLAQTMMAEFLEYWTAPMRNWKPRWQWEKTFDFKARMRTWDKNNKLGNNFTSSFSKQWTAHV